MDLLKPEEYGDYTPFTPIADGFLAEINQTIKDAGKEGVEAVVVGWRNKGKTTALLGFYDVYEGKTIHRALEIPPNAWEFQFTFFSREGLESCLKANEETLRRKKVEPRYCWYIALPKWRKKPSTQKETK